MRDVPRDDDTVEGFGHSDIRAQEGSGQLAPDRCAHANHLAHSSVGALSAFFRVVAGSVEGEPNAPSVAPLRAHQERSKGSRQAVAAAAATQSRAAMESSTS